MTMRLFVPQALVAGSDLPLPDAAARHAMVRRVQPGDTLILFDGHGSDWPARVLAVGRHSVVVQVGTPQPVQREMALHVTVAIAMPANERMDIFVEKATELGVAAIQPLHSQRSVLRLSGDRAERKRLHWQAVAQAGCEQCGRAVVPQVAPAQDWQNWLNGLSGLSGLSGLNGLNGLNALNALHAVAAQPASGARWLLSLLPGALPVAAIGLPTRTLCTLSGPEGGLTAAEEDAARAAGFVAVHLGPRVLRAETAPLAVLAFAALQR